MPAHWATLLIPRTCCTHALLQAGGRCVSLSQVDRAISQWIWFFAAFNSFLGGVVGSTVVSQVWDGFARAVVGCAEGGWWGQQWQLMAGRAANAAFVGLVARSLSPLLLGNLGAGKQALGVS